MSRLTTLAPFSSTLLLLGALVPTTLALITPAAPKGTDTVFRAGQDCTFAFERDPKGLWKTVNVDLFSGSLLDMVNVTRVASGLDGISHNVRFVYECPAVEPPAPIYFYQFSSPDDTNRVWSSRFAIAGEDGNVVKPEHEHQPNGSGEPWGVGRLANGTNSSPNPTAAPTASTSSSTQAWGVWSWNKLPPSMPSTQALSGPTGVVNNSPSAAWPNQAPASAPTSASISALSGFQYGQACSAESACPEDAPCCSEFGFCGTGRNCLAGCNPLGSFRPAACAPVPACRSQEYRFDGGIQRILTNSSLWNGDAEQYDWLVRYPGKPELGLVTVDGTQGASALTLSLAEGKNGTTITSTRSVLYGNVTARIRSVSGPGTLTSFTLLSGTADEILFEFTTNSTEIAQTAYFSRGDVDGYKSGQAVDVTDRAEKYHDYTFAWSPEQIVWLVDGLPVRNVSRDDTASGWMDKTYKFPRSPARIRLSIWAAGDADQPENVIKFAGGPISWNASEYTQKGYYASYVSSVKVDCAAPDAAWSDGSYNLTSEANTTTTGAVSTAPTAPTGTTVTSSISSPLWLAWATGLPAQASVADGHASEPGAALPAASALTDDTIGAIHAPAWLTNARQRRRIDLEKVRRVRRQATNLVSSYSYGDVDDDGYVTIHGGSAPTVASNDAATGLDMSGGLKSVQSSSSGSTSAASATSATSTFSNMSSGSATSTSTSSSSTATASNKPSKDDKEEDDKDDKDDLTLQEKWNKLGTAAHIGIYVGAAAAALFLLVLIGWIWRKATSKRVPHGTPAGYFPVGDRNNGGLDEGDMLPAGPAYTGAGPYDPSQAPPAMAGVSRASSSKSSTSSSKYAAASGGYVPSSVLQQQYGVSYVPNK
ncbi:hypothetical protein JCM10908_003550 [Rhodotorula pacifica]|uniref:uncharacterized protein n=1 Tax=Rhodotorula pacifica TaxID=1495444 RepID=UPI00317FAD9E